MDKMVEELEKNVEDTSVALQMNQIFAQNPCSPATVRKNEDEDSTSVKQDPIETPASNISESSHSRSNGIRRGNSTRYSNIYTEE